MTDAETDKLARKQSKNKLLAQCMENRKRHKYTAPLSSQADVKKCFGRIKKLSEKDQLSILRVEVKLKKVMYFEMLSDCLLQAAQYFCQANV